jgi:hypothetical protein
MYQVPILQPQPQTPSGNPGMILLRTSPLVAIPYDIGQEFPTDPLRLLLAWSNGYWQVVGTYNGQ